VVDALLSLLEEGDVRPTAARIAERAGLSLRSVFQHFADVDALFAAAADRQLERVAHLIAPVAFTGALDERIAAFVRRRTRLLETLAPVRRASTLVEPFSDEVAARLARARRMARTEVEVVFEPELARLAAAVRRDVTSALVVACESSTWDGLRRHQGLSPARARRAVTRLVTALLAPSAEGVH
jgi:AcrR family transcriptional regulator